MAKKGMARPDWTHTNPRNEVSPVPEIQGKAKRGKKKANPIISGTSGATQKVYHTQKPLSKAQLAMRSDPAQSNMENGLPSADPENI